MSGVRYWYIGCLAWQYRAEYTEDHFFRRISGKHDLEHLQKLFREGSEYVSESTAACCTVEPNSSRLPRCGMLPPVYRIFNAMLTCSKDVNHPQGHAKFLQWDCPVEFDIVIPLHLERIPYFLFCSHGQHTHLPPPPHRPPEEIIQGITKLIRRERDPAITRGK